MGYFDLCICSIGDDFQASLEIVALLKENNARCIVARAYSEVHEKFLLRMGADQVVFPEREISQRVASQYSMNNLTDYIELSDEYSIIELEVPSAWIGHNAIECNVRNKYHVNILAYKVGEKLQPLLDPTHPFACDEKLVIMGHIKDLQRLSKL